MHYKLATTTVRDFSVTYLKHEHCQCGNLPSAREAKGSEGGPGVSRQALTSSYFNQKAVTSYPESAEVGMKFSSLVS